MVLSYCLSELAFYDNIITPKINIQLLIFVCILFIKDNGLYDCKSYCISFILIYLQQMHCMLKKNATDSSRCTVLPCYVFNSYLYLFLRTLIKFFVLLVTWFWHIVVVIIRPLLEAKWVKVYC